MKIPLWATEVQFIQHVTFWHLMFTTHAFVYCTAQWVTEWSTPKIYNTLHFYLPNLIFVCHIKYAALNQVCLLSFIVFQYVWWVKHTWIDLVEWVRVEPLCCEFQQWVKRSAGQKTSQFRVFLQRRDQLSGESLLHRQNLKHIRYYTSTSHRQQKIYTLQLFSNITILPFF